jgi:hypothetical protein
MSANDIQHGGNHYRAPVQHWDYVVANEIPYLEAQVIKYLTRWRKKGGKMDVLKAHHFLQKLMEVEGIDPNAPATTPTVPGPVDGCSPGGTIKGSGRRPTRKEVLAWRNTSIGCCERYANQQGCDCLEQAVDTDAPGHWNDPTVKPGDRSGS